MFTAADSDIRVTNCLRFINFISLILSFNQLVNREFVVYNNYVSRDIIRAKGIQ
jgi:hypothetical protein